MRWINWGRARKIDSKMLATYWEWYLTPTWHIFSHCKFPQVMLCVCVCVCFVFLLPGEGEDWASDHRMTDRETQIEWRCTWCIWGPFPCFDLVHFSLPKRGFTELLSAMPSNSPATAEPPQTPEKDTANDVVREINC